MSYRKGEVCGFCFIIISIEHVAPLPSSTKEAWPVGGAEVHI